MPLNLGNLSSPKPLNSSLFNRPLNLPSALWSPRTKALNSQIAPVAQQTPVKTPVRTPAVTERQPVTTSSSPPYVPPPSGPIIPSRVADVNRQIAETGGISTQQATPRTPLEDANSEIARLKGMASQPSPREGALSSLITGQGATPFSGMLQSATEQFKQAQDIAKQSADLREVMAQQTGNVMTNPNLSGSVRTGAASNIATQQGARLSALAGQQQAATGLGTQLTAQAGLIKPSPTAFGQQVFNPATGQFEGGGVSGGSQSMESLAQQVISGALSPSQADSMLPGQTAFERAQLQAILTRLNPSYNRVEAEAQAAARTASTVQTGTIGGQLEKSSLSAQKSLDALDEYFLRLSGIQTEGIPWTNDIAQGIAKFFGSSAVSSYNTALEDARVQVRAVLGTSGVNPVDSGRIVDTYLPQGMTPEILKANMAALKTLIDIRVRAYTTSGGAPGSGTSETGGGVTFAEQW